MAMPFDDADYAGTDTFPPLDPAVSFPYTPVLDTGEETAQESGLVERSRSTITIGATPHSPVKIRCTAISSAWMTSSPSIPMWSTA